MGREAEQRQYCYGYGGMSPTPTHHLNRDLIATVLYLESRDKTQRNGSTVVPRDPDRLQEKSNRKPPLNPGRRRHRNCGI
jgi:hypothetical protein